MGRPGRIVRRTVRITALANKLRQRVKSLDNQLADLRKRLNKPVTAFDEQKLKRLIQKIEMQLLSAKANLTNLRG